MLAVAGVVGFNLAQARGSPVLFIQGATAEDFLRAVDALPADPGAGYKGECRLFRVPLKSVYRAAMIKSMSAAQQSLGRGPRPSSAAPLPLPGSPQDGPPNGATGCFSTWGQFLYSPLKSPFDSYSGVRGAPRYFQAVMCRAGGKPPSSRYSFVIGPTLIRLKYDCH